MNRLFTTLIIIILGCVSFSFAQGLQGKATLSGSANIVTGHSVALTWIASPNATSYNLYRGTASGGAYVQVASGIMATTYTDTQVGHSQTLYYVATAVQGTSESGYSNEAVAVIP
jgi:fibronectin type 3 domain-containing protein